MYARGDSFPRSFLVFGILGNAWYKTSFQSLAHWASRFRAASHDSRRSDSMGARGLSPAGLPTIFFHVPKVAWEIMSS